MKKVILFVLAMLLCFQSVLWAKIWGVKSHDPVSQPPATLFSFDEDGSNFTAIGIITLDSAEIDVDGLALSANDVLYGFQVNGTDSRLITLDKATAQAMVVGNWLVGKDIRGATFDNQGQLRVLATNYSYNLGTIDPASGVWLEGSALFNDNFGDFQLTTITDLVQRSDGAFILTGPNTASLWLCRDWGGKVYPLYTDTSTGTDGYVPAMAGLALSDAADNPEKLFAYDVSLNDDIFTYQMNHSFTRQALLPNIISSYNAGRGDLASRPVALRSNLVCNGSFEEGPASVGNHLHLPAGSTELTDWDIIQGAIDIVGEWEHGDGTRSLDLNGSPGVGAIAQQINTIPWGTYRVRFKMAANTDISPRISRLKVQAGNGQAGATTQEFDNMGLGIWNMGWCRRVWYFTATDTMTLLSFTSLDETTPYYGPTLDSVEVSPVDWIGIPTDFNGSHNVDTTDLVLFLNHWLSTCRDVDWDENFDLGQPGNGRVDLGDFAILAQYWLADDCPC